MSAFAAVAMLGAGVGIAAYANDGTTSTDTAAQGTAAVQTVDANSEPADPTLSAPAHTKTVTGNGDGTYTVSLNVTGDSSRTDGEIVKNQPLDIALVLDVSGSMDNYMGSERRIEALQSAVKTFINETAAQNSSITDPAQQNRIALVKFAGDENDEIGNDKDWNGYNYSQIVSPLTTDTDTLNQDVDDLTAGGATRADYGFGKAQAVLKDARTNAKKVIIFFTDGTPTSNSEYEDGVAADAINTAKSLKDKGTTVYSIGVFSGADPKDVSGNENRFMNYVSSNYPDAHVTVSTDRWGRPVRYTYVHGSRAEGNHYFSATNSSELNNIFESIRQEISKTAKYTDVTVSDKLSQWFVGAASADGRPSDFTYTKTVKGGKPEAWAEAPAATVAADGTVSWPVVADGATLEDGVTYTVSFKVKATQEAYNEAVANHKDDTNAEGNNNFYTNAGASVDYKTVVTDQDGNKVISASRSTNYNMPTATLPVSTIKITKAWKDKDGKDIAPGADSVSVQLQQDGNPYGNPVTLNAGNNWTASVTVPAGPNGHVYTAKENAIAGYTTSYDLSVSAEPSKIEGAGINLNGLTAQEGAITVTNTRSEVTLAANQFVQVQKELSGRTWNDLGDNDGFSFTLAGVDNAPLPKTTSVTVTKADKDTDTTSVAKAFGDITYTEPGTYTYTLTENADTKLAGFAYSAAKFTVTVTVPASMDATGITVKVERAEGADTDGTVNGNTAEFVNRYVAVSALPLTGGSSARDWTVFGGGLGVMALLAVGVTMVMRKRQTL
ncbi:VWA domain-containing protein [Bifidobacterium aerophilum]|uniref:VWA domain-containing protein n=1 Tax=Bifidobacterium aerophilum TaxID=1798155 RepID=A0A6N9Z282_9BIFI|nr:VWA domain-containing protein [Bifidobacterium aerophilum]